MAKKRPFAAESHREVRWSRPPPKPLTSPADDGVVPAPRARIVEDGGRARRSWKLQPKAALPTSRRPTPFQRSFEPHVKRL